MDSDQQSALIRASLIFIGCAAVAFSVCYIAIYYPALLMAAFILGWLGGVFFLIYSWTLHNIKRNRHIAEQEAKRNEGYSRYKAPR
jgi:Flp pilus assembly protein TadB